MHTRLLVLLAAASLGWSGTVGYAAEAGDPEVGRQIFRACAACHSLEPGRHTTGPSLAAIWRRKAGTVEGFTRYSKALSDADVVWDATSLDAWLANPKLYIPGNRMTFRGIPDEAQRRDLIAYLRAVSERGDASPGEPAEGMAGGMMGQRPMIDLKTVEADNRVSSIRHCRDTYSVATESGGVHEFWEFNLRFKTDGSDVGPEPGHPVIIPSGMMGDRAFIVFAAPSEISPWIAPGC